MGLESQADTELLRELFDNGCSVDVGNYAYNGATGGALHELLTKSTATDGGFFQFEAGAVAFWTFGYRHWCSLFLVLHKFMQFRPIDKVVFS